MVCVNFLNFIVTCWFADFGRHQISTVQPLYANEKIPDVYAGNQIFALYSTTISLTSSYLLGFGKYSHGVVKVYTLLDLRGNIPTHFIMSLTTVMYVFWTLWSLEKDPIYVMDRAYVNFAALYAMERVKEIWFEVTETNNTDEKTDSCQRSSRCTYGR